MPTQQKNTAIEYHESVHSDYIDISNPLNELGVKDSLYYKGLANGKYVLHLSNISHTRDQFTRIDYLGDLLTDQVQTLKNGKVLFIGGDVSRFDPKNEAILHLDWKHDFWNYVLIWRDGPDGSMEAWGFSLGKEHNNPMNFFLNNMGLLERYIAYFDATAKDITQIDNSQKLAVFDQNFQFHQKAEADKSVRNAIEFLKQTRLNNLNIEVNNKSFCITRREGQCLYFLLQNYTAKEIALQLDISPRTVEIFIQNVKKKFGKFSKLELACFAKKNDLSKPLELLI